MTGAESDHRPERKILSREDARRLAEERRDSGQPDPCPEIPPSLLSAEHIKKYVTATGAIAPFYIEGGRNSRLKKASYEGRIGERAYMYNRKGMLEGLGLGDELRVEANSIVFVECDLDFRLPGYIALRFNLQIRHVHRGLLLGTGPLVDPGYWGKLCIPLHNLTDEDYSISRDDGLIWVEFTKTTADLIGGNGLGRPPLGKKDEYWNIREFIERAARPRKDRGVGVPIRSSISKVRRRAESAAESAKKVERWVKRTGVVGIIGAAAALLSLALGFFVVIQYAYNSLAPRIDALEERHTSFENTTIDEGLDQLRTDVTELIKENEMLRKRVENLEKDTVSTE